MTARAKGNRSEFRAVKELEAEGWLVHRVKGSTKFNKNVDIFGLFDIVAVYPFVKMGDINVLAPKIMWLQVKTNKKPPFKIYEEFKNKYCDGPTQMVQVWVWYDRKGFKKYPIGISDETGW